MQRPVHQIALLAAVAALARPAHAQPLAAPSRDYVDDFCAPISGGYVSGETLLAHLSRFGARPASSAEGDARRPVDAPAPGQLMRLDAPGAPDAFVDTRGGGCTLVWPGATPPASALATLRDGALPIGEGGAPSRWRPVRTAFAGRPRPSRWLMPMGAFADRGLCAEVGEDLRRRDGAVVSLIRVTQCRLDAGEAAAPPP